MWLSASWSMNVWRATAEGLSVRTPYGARIASLDPSSVDAFAEAFRARSLGFREAETRRALDAIEIR
jgi:hypothetical protein